MGSGTFLHLGIRDFTSHYWDFMYPIVIAEVIYFPDLVVYLIYFVKRHCYPNFYLALTNLYGSD